MMFFWHGLGELILLSFVILLAVHVSRSLIGLAVIVLAWMMLHLLTKHFPRHPGYWQPLLSDWLWVLLLIVFVMMLLSWQSKVVAIISAIAAVVVLSVSASTMWSDAYRSSPKYVSAVDMRARQPCQAVYDEYPLDLQALRNASSETTDQGYLDPELDVKNANDIVDADVASLTGGPDLDGRCLGYVQDRSPDPIAHFTYRVAADGLTVTFDASASKGDKIQKFEWLWADRYYGAQASYGVKQQHRFSFPGTYDVTLIVTDYYQRITTTVIHVVVAKP
jgi:hypothetical protein